jgi:DNA-binding NarL/FixJ family response regulator
MARKLENERPHLPQPASILVVENFPLVRERLKQTIDEDRALALCGETDNVRHALDLLSSVRPALVITGLALRDSNGIDLIVELRERQPETKVLVLSMHQEPHYAEQALRSGARGYVTKQEPTETVMEAIRCVLEGELYLTEEIFRQVVPRVVSQPPDAQSSIPGLVRGLSARELRVFDLIGQGYGTDAIASKLRVNQPTIRAYRARIRRKLQLGGQDGLLPVALQWHQARNTPGAEGAESISAHLRGRKQPHRPRKVQ